MPDPFLAMDVQKCVETRRKGLELPWGIDILPSMDGPKTGGGRLAAVLVILVVLFGVAIASKWLIVTVDWGIWAVLAALIIIALGFVIVNWREKSKNEFNAD